MKLFLFRDDVVPESNDHMEHNLRIPGDPFTVPSSRSGFSRYLWQETNHRKYVISYLSEEKMSSVQAGVLSQPAHKLVESVSGLRLGEENNDPWITLVRRHT